MRRLAFALAASLASTACERREVPGAPDSTTAPAPVAERSAYISVSDLAPEAGATIVVAGTIGVGEQLSLGSFRVRLGFDSTKLRYLDEVPLPGMLRAVNPLPGEIIVAGASSARSSDGRLFAVRFTVEDPEGIHSLSLRIDEINDAGFENQAKTVTRASRLVLDGSLASTPSGASLSSEITTVGWPATTAARVKPTIDSIAPRTGEVGPDRVTDIVVYGKGFAPSGNTVVFGGAEVTGLLSERNGTVIRFGAPSSVPARNGGAFRRIESGRVDVRVRHDGGTSNAVAFMVKVGR